MIIHTCKYASWHTFSNQLKFQLKYIWGQFWCVPSGQRIQSEREFNTWRPKSPLRLAVFCRLLHWLCSQLKIVQLLEQHHAHWHFKAWYLYPYDVAHVIMNITDVKKGWKVILPRPDLEVVTGFTEARTGSEEPAGEHSIATCVCVCFSTNQFSSIFTVKV